MDKLAATRYFLRVADTGSFSKTAKNLNVPTSTVSRRIKDLEDSLGVTLFRRSTRIVSLTDIGAQYYKQVEDAVRSFDIAEELVGQSSDTPSGIIKISALPSYASVHLFPILREFKKLYPKIVIDLNITDHVQDLVRDRVDFAIRPTSNPPGHMIAKVVDQHKMIMVASAAYLEAYGRPQGFGKFYEHKALSYRGSTGVLPWYAFHKDEWHPINKNPSFISNDTNELLDLAINGEGIALLPEWTALSGVRQGLVSKVNVGCEVSFVNNFDHKLFLIYEKKVLELRRNKAFLKFFWGKVGKAS